MTEATLSMLITLIVLSLATWRISSMLTNEDGPFRIFDKLRAKSLDYSEILQCLWCTSVWIGAILLCLLLFYPPIILVYIALSVSTSAILIDRWSQ